MKADFQRFIEHKQTFVRPPMDARPQKVSGGKPRWLPWRPAELFHLSWGRSHSTWSSPPEPPPALIFVSRFSSELKQNDPVGLIPVPFDLHISAATSVSTPLKWNKEKESRQRRNQVFPPETGSASRREPAAPLGPPGPRTRITALAYFHSPMTGCGTACLT